MDQRYYAVTSAANLLKSEIEEKTVIVTEETQTEDGVSKKVYTAKYPGETTPHIPDSIITDASKSLVSLLNTTDPTADEISGSLFLKADGTLPSLECNIEESVQKNGMLVFDISNNSTPKYTLRIIFSSNVKKSAIKPDTSVTWKFLTMRKIRNLTSEVEEEPDDED